MLNKRKSQFFLILFLTYLLTCLTATPPVFAQRSVAEALPVLRSPDAIGTEDGERKRPQIRVSEIVWKFGELKEGSTVQHKIILKNIGNEELKLNVRSSCECLQIQPEKMTISPEGATDLKVSLYTQGYPGKFGKYIYLDTNDPGNQYVTLLVKGEIIRIYTNKRRELPRIKEKWAKEQAIGSPRTKYGAGQDRQQATVVSVTLFSSFNCLFCRELEGKILPSLEKKYGMKISLREYSPDEPKNYEILVSLEKKIREKRK